MDFSNMFPYNQITPVTVDGQSMVKIPKIYVRNTTPTSGTYTGKPCWEMSDYAETGFHAHPAFMNNEIEAQSLQLSVDIASKGSDNKPESKAGATPWVSEPKFNNIKSLAARRNTGTGEQSGWHPWNIYEHHLLARLMLIEYGTPNMQLKLGTQNVNYRGILNPWGNQTSPAGFIIDGLFTDSGRSIQIADNIGKGTMISTGKVLPADGWIKSTWLDKGTLYDLSDVFLPKTSDGTEGNGTFSDYAWTDAGCAFYTYHSTASNYGPFCLNNVSPGSTSSL